MCKKFKNIREMIEYTSEKFANNLAFKLKTGRGKSAVYDEVTYKRLKKEVELLGGYFIKAGYVKKRIAVIGKNSYEWVLVYLAALASGNVIVPLDKELMSDEVLNQLERAEADAVFFDGEIKSAEEIAEEAKKGMFSAFALDNAELKALMATANNAESLEKYKNAEIDGDGLGILLFTSGTTSKSKAVMLSQKNVTANMYSMTIWEDFKQTDVNMALLPLHHTFGLTQMTLFLSLGMCTVFCRGLRVAQCLKEYNVSIFVCVPRVLEVMYDTIMKKIIETGKLKTVKKGIAVSSALKKAGIDIRRIIFKDILKELGGDLRLIIVGAAAVKPEVQKFFYDIGVLSVQGYGLTETSPCITAENEKNMSFGSVGKPIPEVDVILLDKDENGIGEIAACGENVMLGYYKEEEMTNSLMITKNGKRYFRTGDMGYFDKKGLLYISGRKKNVVVLDNGENVFPEELESLLNECQSIKECVVYGKEKNGATVIAAKIVCFENNEEQKNAIAEHIKTINEKLVAFKRIKDFEITDVEFEKTTTLKIKRNFV